MTCACVAQELELSVAPFPLRLFSPAVANAGISYSVYEENLNYYPLFSEFYAHLRFCTFAFQFVCFRPCCFSKHKGAKVKQSLVLSLNNA